MGTDQGWRVRVDRSFHRTSRERHRARDDRVWPTASAILIVIVAITFLPVRAADLSLVTAALAAFLVPFGMRFRVVLRPAPSAVVAVLSVIARAMPAIFTVPLAVATMRPPAGAVTLVPMESVEPFIAWLVLRVTVVVATALNVLRRSGAGVRGWVGVTGEGVGVEGVGVMGVGVRGSV